MFICGVYIAPCSFEVHTWYTVHCTMYSIPCMHSGWCTLHLAPLQCIRGIQCTLHLYSAYLAYNAPCTLTVHTWCTMHIAPLQCILSMPWTVTVHTVRGIPCTVTVHTVRGIPCTRRHPGSAAGSPASAPGCRPVWAHSDTAA